MAHGPGYLLRLESGKAVMEFRDPPVRGKDGRAAGPLPKLKPERNLSMELVNANSRPGMAGGSPLKATASYFSGRGPKGWIVGLPTFAKVNYTGVYPGIDLSFYGLNSRLEYDFSLRPGADVAKVKLALQGAEDARVEETGDLVLKVGGRDVRFLKPVAYQGGASGAPRSLVDVSYRMEKTEKGNAVRLGFTVGHYDHTRDLVIDPVLDYGTYVTALPGSIGYSNASVNGIAVDADGNTYLVTLGGSTENLYYGFSVLKFDPNGDLLSSGTINTDAAGGGVAIPTAIALSSTGAVYVSGYAAAGLPTTASAFQTANSNGSGYEAFVAVLQPNGSATSSALVPSYLSYLGGSTASYDIANSIAVDSHGDAYIAGETGGEPFPTTPGAYQTAYTSGGGTAEFVAKFDPTKSGAASLVYSTLLGSSYDYIYGIAVDAAGSAYVTGSTYPADIPVTSGAFAYSGYGGGIEVNVTKLNPAGTALVYSAYLGPGAGRSIAVDGSGDAYVTGVSYQPDFPTTTGAYQTSYPGAFATELNAAGTALVYSTFLGGPSGATNYGLATPASIALPPACASACAAYIAGITSQTDFPTVNAVQSYIGANPTGFVVELAGNGASAVYSTYLGGVTTGTGGANLYAVGGNGNIPGIGVDSTGNAYTAGNLGATLDFPVTPSPAEPVQAIQNVYLAKIGPATAANVIAVPTSVAFPSQGIVNVTSNVYPGGAPVTATLLNMGSKAVNLTSVVVSPANEFAETDNCNSAIAGGSFCTLTLTFTPQSTGTRSGTIAVTSTASPTPVVIALSGTAVSGGALSWSTASLTFPDTAAGTTSAALTATLTNVGDAPVTGLGNFGYNPGVATTFPILSNCPSQLGPSNGCQVSIRFAPPTIGSASASIYPQGSSAYDVPYLQVSGTGIASGTGGSGSSVVSPASLNLSSLNVGSTTSASIYFTNTGAAVPVTVNSISIALVGNSGSVNDFSVPTCTPYGQNALVPPFQVNAGADCALTVNFTPSVVGTETATITITDSSPNSPHTVTVSGVGLAATQAVEFTPGNQVFLDQPLGYQSAAQSFSVYNSGTAPVVIDRAFVSGDFQITQDTCSSRTLTPPTAPGVNLSSACYINLAFTPTALGARSGTLTLVAGGVPNVLNLMGNGIAVTGAIVPSPNLLSFPAQPVGLTSAIQTVTMTNPGNTTVTVNSLSTTGDFAAAAAGSCGTLPYTIAPTGICQVSVSFTPTSSTVNPRSGTLTINTSAGNPTVTLSGTGEVATQTIGFTPTAASFGTVSDGTASYAQLVYVRNTGTEAVTMNADPAVTGHFSLTDVGCPAGEIIAPGTSCAIGVIFSPSGTGTQAGSLTLTDTAGTQILSLTGNGVSAATAIVVNAEPVNFDLQLAKTSTNANATLYNYGSSGTVHIASASITAGSNAFSLDDAALSSNSCNLDPASQGGTPVGPGSNCGLNMIFSPPASGYYTGTITFVDTAGKTYAGALAGYSPAVVNSATVSPANLGFAAQVVGAAGPGDYNTLVYLQNTGDTSFTVATVTGTNYAAAAASATAEFFTGNSYYGDACSGATVTAGSQCYVGVNFAPTAAGTRTGTLNFAVTYSGATTPTTFMAMLTGTGIAAKNEAVVAPTITVFTDQIVGTTSSTDQYVFLYNTGNLSLTVGTVTGTNYSAAGISATADFSADTAAYGNDADGCSGQSVAGNSYCAIRLQFSPRAAGSRAGALVFPVIYAGATSAVNLTATLAGKGIAATTGVILSPSAVVFANQVVGVTGNYSTIQTVTLSNTGNRAITLGTVTGSDFNASGPTATAEFSAFQNGAYDGCSGQTVGPGASCSVTIQFTPVAAGTRSGSLIFPVKYYGASTAVNFTATLSGVGVSVGNSATLSPSQLVFPNTEVGTTLSYEPISGYFVVSLKNTGNVPLNLGAVTGRNYSASGPSGTAEFSAYTDQCNGNNGIDPQQSCSVYVSFTPTAAGNRTGTLVFPVLYPGATTPVNFTAQLSGTGVATNATLVFSQTSVAFGNEAVGTSSSQVQVTLSNYSANDQPITSIVLGGINASDFTEYADCGTHVGPGGSCTIYLNFAPALNSLGARTAKITETDPRTGGSRTLTLTGTGTADLSAVNFFPASLAFATTETVNEGTAGKVISLNYQGSVPLNVTSVTSTDPADIQVVTDGCSGQAVASGGSCDIEVAFTPTKTGALSAMIKVADSAAGSPQTFVVTGGGSAELTSTTTIAATPASAAFGSLFTLVATVKSGAAGNPPITNGSVAFINGTKVIGTAQVVRTTSGGGVIGTATLKTLYLPVGVNSIKARYTGASATSVSAATTVTVTGKYPSTAVLSASGTQGSYVLTSAVQGGGPQAIVPTGTVAFTDNQTNTLLGTLGLDATTLTQSATALAPLAAGSSNPQTIAMADVNGDGKLDLVVGGYGPTAFSVLLSNGDGTYGAPIAMPGIGGQAANIAVNDLNGDGKLDVVISNGTSAAVFLGNGDGTFQGEVDYDTGVQFVAIGDFNGDGILDIVASSNSSSIDLLLGNGDGTFQDPVANAVPFSGGSVRAADFNGDGKLDVITTGGVAAGASAITVLLGNGNGTFRTPIVSLGNNEPPYRLAIADLNGDGKLDVVSNDNGIGIGVFLGNGDGSFQSEYQVTPYGGVGQPALGDLNADGVPDLILPTGPSGNNTVEILTGKGDGTFGVPIIYPTGAYPAWAAVGDINNDGKLDIAVVNYTDGTVTVLLNTVTQTAKLTGVTLPGVSVDNVTGGYSGDAKYVAATTNTLSLASNPPPGYTVLSATPLTGAEGTLFTLLGEAHASGGAHITTGSINFFDNGNLLASVVIDSATGVATYETRSLTIGTHSLTASFAGTDSNLPSTTNPPALSVTVTGKYATTTALTSTGVQGSYALTATVNGYGLGNPSGSVVFTDNSTNTTLGTMPLTAAGLMTNFLPAATPTLSAGNYPIWVVTGDFNGDGKQDIAASNRNDNTVSVYLGNGDGTFAAQQTSGYVASVYCLVSGDFNGDGKLDLAVATTNNAALGFVGIMIGNGDGTFQPTQFYPVNGNNSYPESIAVADLNGDGKLDVVAGNSQGGAMLSVFLGNGDGTFGVANSFGSLHDGAAGVTIGDFNGDGKPDIAVSVNGASGVTAGIFLGVGDGTFGAETDFIAGGSNGNARAITSGDLNLDGKLDLAVAGDGGAVSVLFGNGDGTFQAGQNYAVGGAPNQPVIADVNGDGKPDLVTTVFQPYSLNGNTGANFVTVLPGEGTAGSFQPVQYFNVAAPGTDSVAVADFNGDGHPDIVTAQFFDAELSILLGSVTEGITLTGVTLPGFGTDNVTAAYSGDTLFAGSASNALTLPSNPLHTATTLSATPATGALGSVFTLKATVKSGTAPVTAGSVSFMDGSTVIGTLQLTSQTGSGVTPGTATLYTRALVSGANSITAQYIGPESFSGSTSSAATVTVTGTFPTMTTLAVSGVAGSYAMAATVTGYGPGLPTGSVNFNDTTANTTLVTGTLAASTAGFALNGSNPIAALAGGNVVTGDFNRDGNLDAASCGDGTSIEISLGNGDGTFQPQQAIPLVSSCSRVAVGDMNGDGKLDLVALSVGGNLVVIPGNGDGTFAAAGAPYMTPAGPLAIKLGDLNGDGKLDVVTADSTVGEVSIFLGNGDGTLQTPTNYAVNLAYIASGGPGSLAIADFDGDGRPDIAVGAYGASGTGEVSILLGSFGGAFVTGATYNTYNTGGVYDMVAADFNGDGKVDLAVGAGPGGDQIFIGNGDGTFVAATGYAAYVSSITTADIDGDGNVDIISSGNGQVYVQLGNGDGTFKAIQSFPNPEGGYENYFVAVGDFNNDHRPDIIATAYESMNNNLQIGYELFLNQVRESATVTGVSAAGTGLHNVVAKYLGDTTFAASTSAPKQVTAVAAVATLTLTAQPNAAPGYGISVSVVATLTGTPGGPIPTGSVSYTIDGGTAQTATISGGTATLSIGSSLAVGPHTVATTYSGDTIYNPASKSIPITVVKGSQVITFSNPGNPTYGSGAFGVYAVSTSGLPVTVKIISGPATVLSNVVTPTGAGPIVLEADQTGNASYNAAPAVRVTFTELPAALSVVVQNATKVYGSANPAFTSMVTGLVGTDTVTVNYTTTATTTSPLGTYLINATISGPSAANYTPTVTAGTLTITKQLLTVTVNNATRVYGAANPTFTGAITGLVGTDTATATYSTTATATSPVVSGGYSITATLTGNNLSNYTLHIVPGNLTLTPAPLTIAVTNASRSYGANNPSFASTFTGVLNGDTVPVAYSTSAIATSNVGTYPISASTTDANYTATIVPGTLTINPATLTVFVNSFTKVYGTANPTLTGSVSGLLFSDAVTTSYATIAVQGTSVGTYSITASISGGASANYIANVTRGALTITRAVLTATAASQTRTYDLPNPALTYAVTGFVNGDTASVVSGTATLTTTAVPLSPIGNYPITFATENLVSTNYSFIYAPGALSVQGGTPQTITFGILPNQTYGASPITLTATASSGLPVSYTVTGPATVAGSTLTITGAGLVTVTASQAGNVDFASASMPQSFSVAKAALTVAATSVSRQYDTPNPVLTYTVTGFVNTDTLASAVTGTATLTTTATLTSQQGGYPITFVAEGLAAANYNFSYSAGTLTVTGGTAQTISFGILPNQTYGASPITLTATASSGLPVSYTVSGPATLSGPVLTITGAGQVTVTALQAGNVNFSAAPNMQQVFTVAKAALTVTAENATMQYGAANPAFSYTVTGFVNNETVAVLGGSATLTTTATSTSLPGSYPITFVTEALTSSNYSFTYVSGTLTVTTTAAATPTLSIASGLYTAGIGLYTAPQYVTISDATPGATIYYTLNGAAPTVNSTVYTSPVYIGTNETLEAVAIATAYNLSGVASATYTFVPVTVSPTTLAFGGQSVLTESIAKTLNIMNPGANVINGFTTSISGADPSDFAVISTGCNGLVNGLCNLNVVFIPQASGARSAMLNVSYAGTGSPVSVPLTGNGTQLTTAFSFTSSSVSLIYGQSLSVTAVLSGTPAPTGTIAYSLDGGTAQSASLSSGSTSIALGLVAAGSHTLAVSYAGNAVYGAASQSFSFTVAKAVLTATAASFQRAYGSANPALAYTTAGFVNGDLSTVVTGTATLTTTATATSSPGTYPITFATEGLAAANYSFSYVAGTLTVTSGGFQSITFGPLPNLTYGASPITLTATASSGLPVTYVVTGPATVSGATLTVTGAGLVTVTASQAGNAIYSAATPVSQSFSVVKTPLTVVAANASRQYGAANPALTYTTTGFVNNDLPTAVSGTATLTTTATAASAPGTYPITFATEGLTAANYSFTYVAGTLTVSSGTLVIVPASGNFGSVALGTTSSAISFMVTNDTASTMGYLGYTNLGEFHLQPGTCHLVNGEPMLRPGQSCVFTAVFKPTKAGYVSGNLSIRASSGTFSVPMTGTGVTP